MNNEKPMDPALVAEFADMLHERRSTMVAQIDAALARIRAGSFGVCTACGGAVEYLHLYLDPASDRCLGCVPARRLRGAGRLPA